jgi:hypothetical protein
MNIESSFLPPPAGREIKSDFFQGKRILLTDARRVGFMLRDGYLTLRNHSAVTTVKAEVVSEGTFTLQATAISGDNYIRVDGDKFKANADASHAAQFGAKHTALGIELFYDNQRPAIFDRYYDVTIGPWTNKSQRSQTPVLMWVRSYAEIWGSQPDSPP